MNLSGCSKLKLSGENGTWFRAIDLQYWDIKDPLHTSHTGPVRTRFSPGRGLPAADQFDILYMAQTNLVALFEVHALLGSTTAPIAGSPVSWVLISVSATLQSVADLSDVGEQKKLSTNVQELTGDWLGYVTRNKLSTVKAPTGIAPTQSVGAALFRTPGVEGFLAVSAKVPDCRALVVFPSKLKRGSCLRFTNPKTGKFREIQGKL